MEKFSQFSRRLGFQLLDRIRGGQVSSALARTRAYYAHPESFASNRAARLQDLLQHARHHIPFYRNLGPGASLSDFPVVDKSTIRSEPLAFRDLSVDFSKLAKVTTSGSTGEPFTCYHDRPKQVQRMADLLYYNGLAGYQLGMRHLLMRATPASRHKQWLMNQIWVDPTRWDEQLCERARTFLKYKQVEIAIGYPSVFSDIARHCAEKGDRTEAFALKAFISTSELLQPVQRDQIGDVFGCDVHSRYATEEFGVLGQASGECNHFSMNTRSLIVEVIDPAALSPVSQGQVGKVVVTDLFLKAMPLIRYDIGDLAAVGCLSSDGLGADVLNSLEGKTAHIIYDTQGDRIAPLSILVAFKKMTGLRQFQFAQLGDGVYELRLCPNDATGITETVACLKSMIGIDAQIGVKMMDRIPSLPSGKTPVVIREY